MKLSLVRKALRERLPSVNVWHSVWVALLFSEAVTIILSLIIRGEVPRSALLLGAVVPLAVGTPLAFVLRYYQKRYAEYLRLEAEDKGRIEDALEEILEKFHAMSAAAFDAIVMVDDKGRIAYWNPAAERIFGYTAWEAVGKELHSFIAPERYFEAYHGGFSGFKKSGKGPAVDRVSEFMARRKDGSEFPIEVAVSAFLLRDRWHAVGIARDITGRRETEDALRNYQNRLEALVREKTADLVMANDALRLEINDRLRAEEELYMQNVFLENVIESLTFPFYVINVEDYTIRMSNSLADRPKGRKTCYSVSHRRSSPCGGKEHPCPLDMVRKTKRPVAVEHVHYDQSGEPRHVEVHGYPVLDSEGEMVQMIEFCLDITDRKQAEAELTESSNRFRKLSQEFNTLLESIPDCLMLLSPDLRVVWANAGATAKAGRSAGELAGRHCFEIWFDRSAPCEDCVSLKALRTGKTEGGQVAFSDGRVFDLRAFPVNDENGNVNVLELAVDITEKVTLQAEAVRAGQLASLGELAAGVAHEINNPLNSIINYAQLALDSSSMESDIAKRIIKEGDRIAGIVRGLLFLARDSKEEACPSTLSAIVLDVLALTESHLRKDGIRLAVDIPEELPRVTVNQQQIQQVFLNVINNARYALNQRYPRAHEDKVIEISGREASIDGSPYVRIIFHDHGAGIPADIMEKVMHPFFTTKPVGSGTGLGLSISRGIVGDHGGMLRIESAEGRYTKVVIDLPAGGGPQGGVK